MTETLETPVMAQLVRGHLVLIGLSGSGKSTVGRELARHLQLPLYDTDTLLAEHAGTPVPELLRDDPLRFRALEEEVVASLRDLVPGIVATGGGVVLSPRNRAVLREGNVVVWLRAPASVLARRVRRGEERPLLAGDAELRLKQLAEERNALYRTCAHETVDTARGSAGLVARRLIERLALQPGRESTASGGGK